MLPETRKWYQNPWVITGLVLTCVVVFGFGLFMAQVFLFVRDIKQGNDPVAAEQQRKIEMSFAKVLNEPTDGKIDISKLYSPTTDPKMGNPKAKVRLVEFVDYECPFSKRTAPELRAFMERHPGEVELVVRDFPLTSIHDHALDASIAARCVYEVAGDRAFWFYYDRLFQNQTRLEPEALRAQAMAVGADLDQFDSCFVNRSTGAIVARSQQDGAALGIKGTPTFFVNGKKIEGAMTLEHLERVYAAVTGSSQ